MQTLSNSDYAKTIIKNNEWMNEQTIPYLPAWEGKEALDPRVDQNN